MNFNGIRFLGNYVTTIALLFPLNSQQKYSLNFCAKVCEKASAVKASAVKASAVKASAVKASVVKASSVKASTYEVPTTYLSTNHGTR